MSKRHSYLWLGLFALGTSATWLVQDHLRPSYRGRGEALRYLLGVAPNFLAGLGLASFFVVSIPQVNAASRSPSRSPWLNGKAHLTGILISVTGLSAWEAIQPLSTRGHFDPHDILWTILGAAAFYSIWWTLHLRSAAG